MFQEALKYIDRRLPVFPCCWPTAAGECACGRHHQGHDVGKVPLTPHGLKDATLTSLGVKEYWSKMPEANIGIAIPPRFFVLDVDVSTGGYESLGILQERHGDLTETWLCTTGSGGQHYWYQTPEVIRNTTRLDGLSGLDIRGAGGYVIAPPSLHKSGGRYTMSDIWPTVIHPAPQWLLDLCIKRTPPPQTGAPVASDAVYSTGSRNDALARQAGAMRRRGMSPEAIQAALMVENKLRCQPPLPESEVSLIARSVSRYQPIPETYTRSMVPEKIDF